MNDILKVIKVTKLLKDLIAAHTFVMYPLQQLKLKKI